MKRNIIVKCLFIIGICILLYPIVAKVVSMKNQTVAISKYVEEIDNMSNDMKKSILELADEYNKNLYDTDTFNSSLENNKESDNNNGENQINSLNFLKEVEVLAYIYIPKINVNLPIYEGTSNSILDVGIGHMENTSLPIGGVNTHSVLVGHTGLSNAILFDNIDKLELGDTFYINCLGNILKYEIIDINTVLPDDTSSLCIDENTDKVTLVTCTPKYINSHRLLVTGMRVQIDESEEKNINDLVNENIAKKNISLNIAYIVFFSIILIIIIIVLILLVIRKKNKRKNK